MILKVSLEGGDLRRIRVEEGADHTETWGKILQAIRRGFSLEKSCNLTLKYKDDEGDLCNLMEHTLRDCLFLAHGGPVRLSASLSPCLSEAVSSSTESPSEGSRLDSMPVSDGLPVSYGPCRVDAPPLSSTAAPRLDGASTSSSEPPQQRDKPQPESWQHCKGKGKGEWAAWLHNMARDAGRDCKGAGSGSFKRGFGASPADDSSDVGWPMNPNLFHMLMAEKGCHSSMGKGGCKGKGKFKGMMNHWLHKMMEESEGPSGK